MIKTFLTQIKLDSSVKKRSGHCWNAAPKGYMLLWYKSIGLDYKIICETPETRWRSDFQCIVSV